VIGHNSLQLNQATINRAVEYYLNEVVLKEPVKVVKVNRVKSSMSSDGDFEVTIQPLDDEQGK